MKLSAILIVALIFVLGQAKKTEDKSTGALARRLVESENVIAKQQTVTDGLEAVRMCPRKCCHTIYIPFRGRHTVCHTCGVKPCPKVCHNHCTRIPDGKSCHTIRYPCGFRWCHHRVCVPKFRNHCVNRCYVGANAKEAGVFETLDESAKDYVSYGNVENAEDEQTQVGVEEAMAKQIAKQETQTGGLEARRRMCKRHCCHYYWRWFRRHRRCHVCMRPCQRRCRHKCAVVKVGQHCFNLPWPLGRKCVPKYRHRCKTHCRWGEANEQVGDFESVDESAKEYYTYGDVEEQEDA